MHIALVNPLRMGMTERGPDPSASLSIWCMEVGRRLVGRGFEVTVLSPCLGKETTVRTHDGVRYLEFPEVVDRRLSRLPGIPSAHNPFARFDSGLYWPVLGRRIAAAVERLAPDVVQVQNAMPWVPGVARAARRARAGARVVLHMQCDWLVEAARDATAARLACCDAVSGCSAHVVDGIVRRFPGLAAETFALWNGVDLGRFGPPTSAASGGARRTVLFVGRLSPEKGAHLLVEAFGRIAARFPDVDLELRGADGFAPRAYVTDRSTDATTRALAPLWRTHRCGRGARYGRALVRSLAPELRDRVRLDGPAPHAALPEVYRRASVFAFPSVWHEPFGMVLAEAMASGLPVVATRSGGVPEFVRDGEHGVLVPRGDVSALAEGLARVLEDPAGAASMGAAGRRHAEQELGWDRVAERFAVRLGRLRAGHGAPAGAEPEVPAAATTSR